MLRNKIKLNYDIFHVNTSSQHKIIKDNNFTYKIILKIVNSYLNQTRKNSKVLDIGCGAGTLSLYLASRGYKTLGIDISEKAISIATQSAHSLNLTNISFKQMNFPTEIPRDKYDFIIFSEVLEHLEDDNLSLNKVYELLNPNGICILSTPSQNAPMYKLGFANSFDKKVGHLRRYNLDELTLKCKKARFTILETKRTEGVLRNFLFLNPLAGKFIRFIRFYLVDLIMFIDNISLILFGESQIFVILTK